MSESPLIVKPIGRVRSVLSERSTAPRQGDEGAPDAWIDIEADVADGIRDLRPGEQVILLTWLDRARRDVLTVHPRRRVHNPAVGVFSTRSPDRPNPVGLHQVTILAIAGLQIHVANLEALDGTPVVDIKPLLGPVAER
jgi:tRNA-Thr(GGU) m(6)t(6)A37 methyltransferase TsaA